MTNHHGTLQIITDHHRSSPIIKNHDRSFATITDHHRSGPQIGWGPIDLGFEGPVHSARMVADRSPAPDVLRPVAGDGFRRGPLCTGGRRGVKYFHRSNGSTSVGVIGRGYTLLTEVFSDEADYLAGGGRRWLAGIECGLRQPKPAAFICSLAPFFLA